MNLFNLVLLSLALALAGCGKKSAVSENQATLADLNRLASSVAMQTGGKVDTNQVASLLAGQGKSFPRPPAGKKLLFSHATQQFEFVDQ